MKLIKFIILFFPFTIIASPQGVPHLSIATIGTSSTLALPANSNRGYLIMQNQGTASCLVNPAGPVVTPDGLIILPGQNYEMQEAFTKGAIYFQCGSAGNRIAFLETNF